MTRPFIHEDFLLESRTARTLFHEYAEGLPIIDYHCHLSPADIAGDRRFGNLTQAWLAGDHYKWRAMRTCGVDEKYITGKAPDWEKFRAWAATVPKTLRNPLHHWTHMELRRPFGITDRLLGPGTARSIWEECNAMLATPEFSVRGILRKMNVRIVCTTDDPTDTLEHHRALARNPRAGVKMFPAFRADRAMDIADPKAWAAYVSRLAAAAGMTVRSWQGFLEALRSRHAYFHRHGCRLSDHGLETVFAAEYTEGEVRKIFSTLLGGRGVSPADSLKFRSAVLRELALMDHGRGWVQQFHLGALRNNNTRMMRTLGPDTGYDSIGDFEMAGPLSRFLDRLDADNRLAKTILYNLNPRDNELFATMIGNFQDGSAAGKIQYGAAWWFLDQADGMRKQLDALSNMGLLSQFVGMLTDSRSFLSYPRHEYFRRLLCNILGSEIERGLLPNDVELAGNMVRDICHRNAARYFPFVAPGRTKGKRTAKRAAAGRKG
jgi:glucuronate isomerase